MYSVMIASEKSRDPRAHKAYIESLRRMTPEQRLQRAVELSETVMELFLQGMRERHPDAGSEEFDRLVRERLAKCHNRNY